MKEEDSLHFVQERLRHRHASPLTRELHLRRRPSVIRRFAVALARGRTHVLDKVDSSVRVRCAKGSLWITQDGDPKDVILGEQQTYQAEREQPMHLSALQPCVLEIEFEDEVLPAV
jgi:hypothetical protein